MAVTLFSNIVVASSNGSTPIVIGGNYSVETVYILFNTAVTTGPNQGYEIDLTTSAGASFFHSDGLIPATGVISLGYNGAAISMGIILPRGSGISIKSLLGSGLSQLNISLCIYGNVFP